MKAAALALLLAAAVPAHACGVCAEDKVAATYDHRSVQEALARGRVVVYCEVTGLRDVQRARQAAARVRGVDARSVRVSAEPAALSFVLDPKQQPAPAAVLALQAALPPGARLAILKVEGGAP
ncbi:hypothetical protein GCM10028796_05520 [Ramlibacter monticola]|uniref:HMA domain-containing protein n=1 Tax=Ramlibacter monticola TaxID=1926872 RepID=A0A937CTK4_9BURK|nr:hypothetical protein [Ramlibacter monticola]MBL0391172.1 hypothetical protein [Ramlibacter monticola]